MFQPWLFMRPPAPVDGAPPAGGGGGAPPPPAGGGGASTPAPKVEAPKVAAPKGPRTVRGTAPAEGGATVHTPPPRGITGTGAPERGKPKTEETDVEERESPDDDGEAVVEGEGADDAGAGAEAEAPRRGGNLARLLGDDAPDWLEALAEELPDDFDVDPANLTIREQRLLAHLHKQGKKGQQVVADRERALQIAERIANKKGLDGSREKADGLAAFKSKVLDELIKGIAPKDAQPDPSTPEGVKWLIDNAVGKRLQEFRDAVVAEDDKRLATYRQEEAVATRAEQVEELKAYAAKYPDDFAKGSPVRARITELIKKSNGGITYKEAHKLAVAEALEGTASEDERTELRTRAKARSKPGGGHGRPVALRPKDKDGKPLSSEEEAEFYEKNPAALAAARERHGKRSGMDAIRERKRKAGGTR